MSGERDSFYFSPAGGSTVWDARFVQETTLADLQRAGVPGAKKLANPNSPALVMRQWKRLVTHPDRYEMVRLESSTRQTSQLVGVAKINEWRTGDQRPFATPDELARLDAQETDGIFPVVPPTLGIFALLTRRRLDEPVQRHVAELLLERADRRATQMSMHAIKVVLTENDPLMPVYVDAGYESTDRIAEVPEVPGIKQFLFVKPLDLHE